GTAVLAADGGTVSVATYSSSYGNYVMLYHADGTTTLYAHMSSLAVSAGQTVSQGSTIGYVGETGWAKGPHLHFEVRKDGATLDPLAYFSNYSLAPDA
ncbi:MAG: M23 family metallopeptidase, partial [Oscillospiraceae bacterium]|nr:M23 family metallopeptidase [Oscillospiraceae bacterium]